MAKYDSLHIEGKVFELSECSKIIIVRNIVVIIAYYYNISNNNL